MLYPQENKTREVKDLSGIWKFKVDNNSAGSKESWHTAPLTGTIPMPVPSSYNDITQQASIRDHIGNVWYETSFHVPQRLQTDKRLVLRFGSVTHQAAVWINGKEVIRHKGGFLPFEADITEYVDNSEKNTLTVMANNELSWQTLPPGETIHSSTIKKQEYHFDFFNYAGIHRPVKLLFRPSIYIKDISVKTDIEGNTGKIDYTVTASDKINCKVTLFEDNGKMICAAENLSGQFPISSPKLWDTKNPYLYKLKVELINDQKNLIDEYELPVGIRTVKIIDNKLLLNDREIYLKGFGKHEDSLIRGRGLDNCTNVKDLNLLKWINANSFRTSHYPYSEEIMNLADQYGILIIDECPAVGMYYFGENDKKIFSPERVNNDTLQHHIDTMTDLVKRDKNHPSVIMWSVANEAATEEEAALAYFEKVIARTRELDSTRPITMAQFSDPDKCKVSGLLDIICINRYYSWYINPGKLETIEPDMKNDLLKWHTRFKKPIIISEYGADTISGFHSDPPVMFSEEYQIQMLDRFHQVFDSLDFVIGEHVWNFADFATKQGITRVMGNKKGVFTRDRQPKMVAHSLKKRWSEK
ncbi:MAG: beta-glucuronidase [Sedimentisphaeraceae bacterium JB056]